MISKKTILSLAGLALAVLAVTQCMRKEVEPVDYVNPHIGGVSHLLVPTYPTTHLPNSMLRVYPARKDYTTEYVSGLPVVVTNHREKSAFSILPLPDGNVPDTTLYNYDNEHIYPYCFDVELADNSIKAEYALSHQSAIYHISFADASRPSVALTTEKGSLDYDDRSIYGHQQLANGTKVYVWMESEEKPLSISGQPDTGNHNCVVMRFDGRHDKIALRYGVSYISCEQARANLRREIADYNLKALAQKGRQIWNETLGRIKVKGGSEEDMTTFYSSFYRTFERPVCISEDGRYFSAYDHQVHEDGGTPFYVDDWLWDTYRAAHPLRCMTDAEREQDIIASFLRMAQQSGEMWMPTFPEVTGDSRRMNSNHGIPVVAEAMAMGLEADYPALYEVCSRAVDEKTLAPWSAGKAGWIDNFYKQHGYIPALRPGEEETDPNVHFFEKRQPVAVTLGTAYDQWCLHAIANTLGLEDEAALRRDKSLDYRNIYNPATAFFHPKDRNGHFIEPLNYSFCGGLGGRLYYGENNAWVYRWDVQHNIADLIELMGGKEAFCRNLDATFGTPLGKSKFSFYAMLPDHTGNVGQFSMANEPSLHVPYLYNYAGKPWKTQKRVRQMLSTWFRDDLMGMPGDEDGGGMTSFVVFSMMGIYPVTPGTATYNIGSPVFPECEIALSSGKSLKIVAENASSQNKYIQSAKLNGKSWDKPWLAYNDIKDGATLKFVMGPQPNKEWGCDAKNAPPSAFFAD